MKHTPGPWSTRGLSDHVRVERVDGCTATNVARCGSSKPGPREPKTHDEVWANALLIAAAPDMLATLKNFMEWSTRPGLNWEEVVPQIESAIAKAEGRRA